MRGQKPHKNKSIDGFTVRSNTPKYQARFPVVGVSLPVYRRPNNTQTRPRSSQLLPQTARAAESTKKARFGGRSRAKSILKRVIISFVVLFLLVGLFLGGKFIYNASKIFRGNIFSALTTTKLKGEDTGRVNILLAGNSADDPGHGGANLTDSIMILSIDTKNNTAFMLSVPRDLWVNIPGYGHHKINQAYNDGVNESFSEPGYPDGGMGLLEQVIGVNFGININYYSLINYSAFRQAVDAVGGITVTIASSDSRGLYDSNIAKVDGGPLKLSNGIQKLDGKTALNLARARGDGYRAYGLASDFDRTNNQRMMLVALKSKMFSSGVITNPVRLSSLMDALGANVKTDLKLSEVRRLADLGNKVGNNNIKSLSLNNVDGKNLLANYSSPTDGSALIPAKGINDFSEIQRYIKRILSTNPVVKENATIVVLNGTDTFGLAGKNAELLQTKGLNVTVTGDSLAAASVTQIINTTGTTKPATLKLLQGLYGTNVTTTNTYKGKYDVDFIIVLGDDQLKPVTR